MPIGGAPYVAEYDKSLKMDFHIFKFHTQSGGGQRRRP